MACDPDGSLTFSGISSGGDYQRMIEALLKDDVAVVGSESRGHGVWKLQIALPERLAMETLVGELRGQGFDVT